jgi:alpha-galactosidase
MNKRFLFGITLLFGVCKLLSQTVIPIHTDHTSMVLSVASDSTLLFQYYGDKIQDCSYFANKQTYRRFDYGTDPLAYPTAGGRFFNEPAFSAVFSDGDLNTELKYIGHKDSLIVPNEIYQTTIDLADVKQKLNVSLVFKSYVRNDIFTVSAVIENKSKKDICLTRFYSSFLSVRAKRYYLTTFYGAWAQEMGIEESLLTHGIKSIESKKGVRTTHTENPAFMLSLDTPLQEEVGRVIAGALAWSGNYKINFQLDEFNLLGISSGINPFMSDYKLKYKERLVTPEMIYTYSNKGAGQASRNLHDYARKYVVYDTPEELPTLLNSWEGAYFNFDEAIIQKMIDDAAEIGLEMFVLDDGWFGNKYPRNSSKQGLGDWQVTQNKLPNGIGALVDYATRKGLKFGLWIEPEMVNPKSELAEKHPDWIVKAKNRKITTMRGQWLLDLTNPEVQDFIVETFKHIMTENHNIAYIKWDANRHVESVGSDYLAVDKQSHFWIDYTKGLYSVYNRIRSLYPHLLIQACSSGGGRVDYGALKFHQEVWTSDNTDALSRIFIQYGTNMIYPASVTGSHVSASPNHQTGNRTSLKFRFDVAMGGRLGMELQPQALDSLERAFARNAISQYKTLVRPLVFKGDLYRLISPYEESGFCAYMYTAKDKSAAVVYAYNLKYQGRTHFPQLKLSGLSSQKMYKIREINTIDKKSVFWGNNQIFSGQYLMNEGINLKLTQCNSSAVFYLEEVNR